MFSFDQELIASSYSCRNEREGPKHQAMCGLQQNHVCGLQDLPNMQGETAL